jgi:uncharacterized cupin superfamily protein
MENIYANDWDATEDHPGFNWDRMRLGRRLGGEMLGASIYLIQPGQKSFPYHLHHANEELLIVLEGSVSVRTPEGEQEATTGDAMLFRRGPDGAHQVRNHTGTSARFLMISTMVAPEISEYPDSGNIGVFPDRAPGSPGDGHRFLHGGSLADYFEDV